MQVTFVRSSTVLVEVGGFKLLMDPWLTEGEYYGSWHHYPPIDFPLSVLSDVSAIFISHIHPDHFSKETLSALPKHIPVYVHGYAEKFLKANIERLGFKVYEIPHGERVALTDECHLTVLAADDCDPVLCGRFMGCDLRSTSAGSMQIDSVCIVDDGNQSVVNVNDCPFELAQHAWRKVKDRYPHPDLLMVGYSGAGPYPQCFATFSDDEKTQKAKAKQAAFLKQAEQFIDLVRPRYFLPFAGTYVLGGKLARLNRFRGVPTIDEASMLLENSEAARRSGSKCIRLNPFASFDLRTTEVSAEYQPADEHERERYLTTVLESRRFDYEADPLPTIDELRSLVQIAHARLVEKASTLGYRGAGRAYVPLIEGEAARISFAPSSLDFVPMDTIDHDDHFVSFGVDPRLLVRLLKGPRFAHWNNAEIGSHITYRRFPDEYDRALYHLMNYLHQ
jgi:UDP-MurNAc hydroxylase